MSFPVQAGTENRKYRARGLASYHVRINAYTGPFDILLKLIAERKLKIEEVELSTLTLDYLMFLKANIDEGIKLAPEFIRVAALLVSIKTGAIYDPDFFYGEDLEELPQTEEELFEILKTLKKAGAVAEILRERINENCSAIRLFKPFSINSGKILPDIKIESIIEAWADIIRRNPEKIKEEFVGDHSFMIDKMVEIIVGRISVSRRLNLFDLVKEIKEQPRRTIISAFLAALKLKQEGRIEIEQTSEFGDIYLVKQL